KLSLQNAEILHKVVLTKKEGHMRRQLRLHASLSLFLIIAFSLGAMEAYAQCTQVTSGLRAPLGIVLSNQNKLLVSETCTPSLDSGRISIIDPNGQQRTLLAGLPSALNDVNEPSGPAGLFMRGRTLYVAMGTGDAGRPGPVPGTTIPNPSAVSSPIFSSV